MENNQTKEKLLAEIDRLKKELKKKKKYGLVWEDKPEDVVEMCKEKLPVLKEVKSKEIITDKNKPMNLLIEGDNYHALSVLNYTHKGKIDVIYIDPPYNTGNKDFIFNDKYVDREDGYRHSKWVSFIDKRLRLVKGLLKNTGIIFISIDDNEQSQLKLLCDEIFGEENFVSMLNIESGEVFGTKAAHADKTFVKVKDYVLVYAKNKSFVNNKQPLYDSMRELYDSHFNTIIENDFKKYSFIDLVKKIKWVKELFIKNELKINAGNINLLMNINERFRNWVYNDVSEKLYSDAPLTKKIKQSILDSHNPGDPFIFENRMVFKTTTGSVRMFLKFKDSLKISDDFQQVYTRCSIRGDLWKGFHFDMRNVQHEGEIDFKNGKKPIRLVMQLCKWFNKKDLTILDFFAGSGTTGQAILELNKQDGGNREFILCTNNENKIAEEIIYPRIQKIIGGYKKDNKGEVIKGLSGNLKYFKTDFVDYKESTDRNKIKLTKEAVEMLCVKEGTFEEVMKPASAKATVGRDFKIFKNHDHYTGIIFDQLAIADFKKAISAIGGSPAKDGHGASGGKDIKGKISVYIFSLGDDSFEDEFEDIKQKVKLSPIPEAILKVYRRIYK
ncbi:MAG: site-specific DNA-methyltransferase [Patescibacteria group bacterium]